MAIGCGANCAKMIVLLINFIFMLIGVVLLAFGIFLVIDTKALHSKFFIPIGGSADLIISAAIVITVVGLIIFLITIVGCCATVKEHTGCITFYSIILIFLLIVQIVAVILAGAFYDQIMGKMDSEMVKLLQQDYGIKNETTEFIDSMQFDLNCCGITEQGPLDWSESHYHKTTGLPVPDSCCTTTNGSQIKDRTKCLKKAYDTEDAERSTYVYTQGCDKKLDALIKNYVGILIGVVIGVVVVQIIFIVITCLLKSSIVRGYEYV